jgi:kynurenine formamidase
VCFAKLKGIRLRIDLPEVSVMPVPTEQIDDLIARIGKSLEEIAGTQMGDELFTTINECLHEFVEEASSPQAEVRHEKRPREYHADDEDERSTHRDVIDLSLLLAPKLPCTWPSSFLPPFVLMRYLRHGPGPYASEAIVVDEHTGSHWDAPAHFIPPPISALPNNGQMGNVPSDQIPVWSFTGEGCVVDVRDLVIGPDNGVSSLILPSHVQAWEQANRPLEAGDAVLFYTGYSDRFYKPLPQGRRFVADPLGGTAPGYPGVDSSCMDYLVSKNVSWVGIDGPNIGPIGIGAVLTHVSALQAGVLPVENLVDLGTLPATGSFVCILGPKHAAGSGGEARIIAIKETHTASRLIASAKNKNVVDLSVLLREDMPVSWPGVGAGNYRMPYLSRTLHSWEQPGGPALVRNHILDAHTGTHLVPPAYAVPQPGFDRERYDQTTRRALRRFEDDFGDLGTTEVTADRADIGSLVGNARIIDVTHLLGKSALGKSPAIRVEHIERSEEAHGRIREGDIVIFHSGYSDLFFKPFPYGSRCISDPINGLAEGWPAATPEVIIHLARKGVRCIGTDGPTMGGADPDEALRTYWAGGQHGLYFVEYLTNVGVLPPNGSYFLFAPVKIIGCHGGHGRAIALF